MKDWNKREDTMKIIHRRYSEVIYNMQDITLIYNMPDLRTFISPKSPKTSRFHAYNGITGRLFQARKFFPHNSIPIGSEGSEVQPPLAGSGDLFRPMVILHFIHETC